jgi:hypothetical protein
VSGITYNGIPLTQKGYWPVQPRVEIWYLVAPPTGAHDVVITFSANLKQGAKAGVMTFTGVNQSTPLGTFAHASGTTTGPATVNVTSATNELVFDTLGCQAVLMHAPRSPSAPARPSAGTGRSRPEWNRSLWQGAPNRAPRRSRCPGASAERPLRPGPSGPCRSSRPRPPWTSRFTSTTPRRTVRGQPTSSPPLPSPSTATPPIRMPWPSGTTQWTDLHRLDPNCGFGSTWPPSATAAAHPGL